MDKYSGSAPRFQEDPWDRDVWSFRIDFDDVLAALPEDQMEAYVGLDYESRFKVMSESLPALRRVFEKELLSDLSEVMEKALAECSLSGRILEQVLEEDTSDFEIWPEDGSMPLCHHCGRQLKEPGLYMMNLNKHFCGCDCFLCFVASQSE